MTRWGIAALQQGFPHLIDQVRTGRAEFFGPDEITRFDRLEAQRGWDVAKGAIASGLYSVVVLDELNPVLNLGLLPVDEVVQVLKSKPESWYCYWSAAPQHLLDIADLHSEMKPTSTLLRRNRVFPELRFIQVRVKESLPVRSVRRCKRLAELVRISLTAS